MTRQLDVTLMHMAEMAAAFAANETSLGISACVEGQVPAAGNPSSMSRNGREGGSMGSVSRRPGSLLDDPRAASMRSLASNVSHVSKRIVTRDRGAVSLRMARADSLRLKRRNSALASVARLSSEKDVSHGSSIVHPSPLMMHTHVSLSEPVPTVLELPASNIDDVMNSLKKAESNESKPSFTSSEVIPPHLSVTATELLVQE